LSGRELSAAEVVRGVTETLSAETGWSLNPGEWTGEEQTRMEELVRDKYGSERWNRKR